MTALGLLAVPAIVALLMVLLNALTWTRGRSQAPTCRLSVCIPARDEIATIEAAVRSALASNPLEVVVCNDNSVDGTDELVERIAADDLRLRVIHAPPLPSGWVGKVRACHLLAQHARGDTLVFVDADTVLLPGGLARVADLLGRYGAGVVTAMPRQQVLSMVERMVVPLLHVTYTAWLPLALVWCSPDPPTPSWTARSTASRHSSRRVTSASRPAWERASCRGALADTSHRTRCHQGVTPANEWRRSQGTRCAACTPMPMPPSGPCWP